jgi:hypothetical protein
MQRTRDGLLSQALEENADKIHTVYLTGVKQIQNLLLFGKRDV